MFTEFFTVHIVSHPYNNGVHMVFRSVSIAWIAWRNHLVIRQIGVKLQVLSKIESGVEVDPSAVHLCRGYLSFLISILSGYKVACFLSFIGDRDVVVGY